MDYLTTLSRPHPGLFDVSIQDPTTEDNTCIIDTGMTLNYFLLVSIIYSTAS